MIKMYIITALRSFKRQPLYTAINFLGLSIAMVCIILIVSWIRFQLSYDNFNKNYDAIFQLNAEVHWGAEPHIQSNLQASVVPEMIKRYPEIKDITRINYQQEVVFKYADKLFSEDNIMLVDSGFFNIFSFPLKKGSIDNFFSDPHNIVFTKSMVKKYFGDEDPIGKVVGFNNINMTVVGVTDDAPNNSSFQFDFITPFQLQGELYGNPNIDNNWDDWYLFSFLTFNENVNVADFNKKIGALYADYPNVKTGNKLLIHPFKEMRLRPPRLNDDSFGIINSIYIISFIALMILIVACVNFMNLSTACFSGRAKDVGIRKTIGAKRKMLLSQFMFESFILAFTAGISSVVFAKMLLPGFNWLVEETIEFRILDVKFFMVVFSIILFSGLLAGSYPSFYLSSFKPARVLKGKPLGKKGKNNLRMGLVIFQFAISIFLIVSTLFSTKQLKFMLNKDLGFKKDMVINVKLNDGSKYRTIKQELIKNPNINKVTGCNWWGFNMNPNTYGYDYDGKPEGFDELVTVQQVDYDYLETLGIEMVQGRSFSKDFSIDETGGGFILNETAIKIMGIDDPIGKTFTLWGNRGQIIGVMKDVHLTSLYSQIDPRILFVTPNNFSQVLIKMNPVSGENKMLSISNMVKSIEKDWNEIAPDIPFEYSFLDELHNRTYRQVRSQNRLMTVFAIMAIFISSIGLFGLAIYATEQKNKEIGVRKVNGAYTKQVIGMLLNEFLKYIIISFIVVVPLAYWFVEYFLEIFAYRTKLSWWLFFIAGGVVAIISILTVCFQSWQAARRNPVESLRYE